MQKRVRIYFSSPVAQRTGEVARLVCDGGGRFFVRSGPLRLDALRLLDTSPALQGRRK